MGARPEIPGDGETTEFSSGAWRDVLRAVDRTYAELVAYQEQLEAKNAELDALRRFMASVLDSVSDVLVAVTPEGRIEHASRSRARQSGRAASALVGTALADLITAETRGSIQAAIGAALAGASPAPVEAALASPEGPAPLEITIAARRDDRGRSRGAVLTGRPVGELRRAYSELAESHRALKEAQALLVRNEKLASLGRLLAGVAHELNNPISFVYANAHALEKYLGRFEAYFERVQAGASREELIALRADLKLDRELKNLRLAISGTSEGAERVRDIVENLRRLSADGVGDFAAFDLTATTRIAADWVSRGMKRPVRLVIDAPGPVMARGRPGHVQQVVMNLVQNAIDALKATADPAIAITIGGEGDRVFVEVADNGPGIPPETAAAIFDPFFTTKPVGDGTGLGLAISHKIAEEHGGTLKLLPSGTGARFRLDLPGEAP